LLKRCAVQKAVAQTDPLSSWNDEANKQVIINFVTKITKEGGPDFVPPAERIATLVCVPFGSHHNGRTGRLALPKLIGYCVRSK
jgi:hypothetical protein